MCDKRQSVSAWCALCADYVQEVQQLSECAIGGFYCYRGVCRPFRCHFHFSRAFCIIRLHPYILCIGFSVNSYFELNSVIHTHTHTFPRSACFYLKALYRDAFANTLHGTSDWYEYENIFRKQVLSYKWRRKDRAKASCSIFNLCNRPTEPTEPNRPNERKHAV